MITKNKECKACWKINSMISFCNTEEHTCEELNGQRSFRFYSNSRADSVPNIRWIHENDLNDSEKDLLFGDTLKKIDELPKSLKDKIIDKILTTGKL